MNKTVKVGREAQVLQGLVYKIMGTQDSRQYRVDKVQEQIKEVQDHNQEETIKEAILELED